MVMIFQSMAVSFGAAGAPIWIGVSDGLGGGNISAINSAFNITNWDTFLVEMGYRIAFIHGSVGLFVPLIMVVLLCGFFGKNKSFKEGFGAWKFALFGGLSVSIPYVLSALLLGPEFPSIFGGLIGIIPVIIAAKKGWFMPKDTVWQFPEKNKWDKSWMGILKLEDEKTADFSVLKSWTPYIIMAILLFVLNVRFLPFSSMLSETSISFNNLFGTEIGTQIDLIASPGTIFIVVSLFTVWFHKLSLKDYYKAFKSSFKTIAIAASSLIFAVPMVQVFLNSGGGSTGLDSIPNTLANSLTFLSGDLWAFIAPLVGALGAFLAGSNVFSNLMFSQFQVEMSVFSNISAT